VIARSVGSRAVRTGAAALRFRFTWFRQRRVERLQTPTVVDKALERRVRLGAPLPRAHETSRRYCTRSRTPTAKGCLTREYFLAITPSPRHSRCCTRLCTVAAGAPFAYSRGGLDLEYDEVWCEVRSAESGFKLVVSHKGGAEEINTGPHLRLFVRNGSSLNRERQSNGDCDNAGTGSRSMGAPPRAGRSRQRSS
jgi:hypothetical protein